MKYRFMNDHRHEHAVSLMCRVLQVARAGFYESVYARDCALDGSGFAVEALPQLAALPGH